MTVTTAMIKELREATGAGILDSKKALEAAGGNFDQAVEHLREKGLAKAAKKASREANEGLITVIVTDAQASLIEVNCETDFVARTDDFKALTGALAQQVFHNPDLTSADKLLAANYQADPGKTVANVLQETISKLGENIVVRRLERYTRQGPGVIDGYVHLGGRIGVLVELGVEEAAAEGETLSGLAHDLALHIAAANPRYLRKEEIPDDVIAVETKIYMAQLAQENKPEHIKAKIVQGRLNKLYKEVCLLEQA
ncbi:MAG: translation elongation factor Ts, partial [Anaerolineae bacterium]